MHQHYTVCVKMGRGWK